jgi:PAS domain-containing protein
MQANDTKRHDVAAPKPIQIILARQLAGSLAMPILLMDTAGTLIYYNESAEAILGQHFDETGEMLAEDWSKLFAIEDDARNPIATENRPMMLAISGKKPISRAVWMRCGDREWRYLNITAYPLIGEGGQFLGAQMIFWEI